MKYQSVKLGQTTTPGTLCSTLCDLEVTTISSCQVNPGPLTEFPFKVQSAVVSSSPPCRSLLLVLRRVTSPEQLIRWYSFNTWMERGVVRVKSLAQEHNTTQCPRLVLEPGPLDPGPLH